MPYCLPRRSQGRGAGGGGSGGKLSGRTRRGGRRQRRRVRWIPLDDGVLSARAGRRRGQIWADLPKPSGLPKFTRLCLPYCYTGAMPGPSGTRPCHSLGVSGHLPNPKGWFSFLSKHPLRTVGNNEPRSVRRVPTDYTARSSGLKTGLRRLHIEGFSKCPTWIRVPSTGSE